MERVKWNSSGICWLFFFSHWWLSYKLWDFSTSCVLRRLCIYALVPLLVLFLLRHGQSQCRMSRRGGRGEAHKEEKLEREKQIKAMRKRKTRNNISRHLSQWTKWARAGEGGSRRREKNYVNWIFFHSAPCFVCLLWPEWLLSCARAREELENVRRSLFFSAAGAGCGDIFPLSSL